jgi:hypothetical protein
MKKAALPSILVVAMLLVVAVIAEGQQRPGRPDFRCGPRGQAGDKVDSHCHGDQ